MKVGEVLKRKAKAPVVIGPNDTITKLCVRLRENRVGAAVVSTDGRSVEGVVTERDIAYAIAKDGSAVPNMRVEQLMTRAVVTCTPSDAIALVASTMLSRGFRHIPVVSDGALAGMISIRDVLGMRVEELQQNHAELHAFIAHADQVPQDRG
jgi:CBS domain-containing protein